MTKHKAEASNEERPEDMPPESKMVDPDTISEDPANVRLHSKRNLEALEGSLRRFGQRKPIIVTRDNVITAGNATFRILKKLGKTKVWVVVADLTGSEATAFGIADNRTAELATGDEEALNQQLASLRLEDPDLAYATGFILEPLPEYQPEESESGGETAGTGTGVGPGMDDRAGKIILVYQTDEERQEWFNRLGIKNDTTRVIFALDDLPGRE